MAAVEQRTPTPDSVDPRKRTAFIESMEEEMRRVAEHLERRGTRRGVVTYSSNRPVHNKPKDAVNGWNFAERDGSEAGARRRRINKHPRTLSAPPSDFPPDSPIRAPLSATSTETTSEESESWSDREGRGDSRMPYRGGCSDSDTPTLINSFIPQKSAELQQSDRIARESPVRSPPPVPPKPKSKAKKVDETVQCLKQPASLESRAPPHPSHKPHLEEELHATSPPLPPSALHKPHLDGTREELNGTPTELFSPPPLPPPVDRNEDTPTPTFSPPPPPLLLDEREELDATPTPMFSPPPLSSHELHTDATKGDLDATSAETKSPPPPPLPPKPSVPPPPDSPPPFSPSPSPSPPPSPSPSPPPSSSPKQNPPTLKECSSNRNLSENSDTDHKVSETTLESDVNMSTQDFTADSLQVSAPEVKSLPVRNIPGKQNKQPQEVKSTKEEHKHTSVARHEFRSKTDSKIQITVSSSVDKSRTLPKSPREDHSVHVRELQKQLREKEEELERTKQKYTKELHQREEQIKKLAKEGHKLEREKWELLKRARDGAERSLHLRTQLDMKEGTFRSMQGELERTRDELLSVKSANTSLRALLNDLRAPKASVDVGIQVSSPGGTLRRNHSIELAYTQGGLSQEQDSGTERPMEYRLSTSTLGDASRERSVSVASMNSSTIDFESRETTPIPGYMTPQPGEKHKKERKKKGPLFGKLRRSIGKGGSTTSVEGLDLTHSSMIQGAGMRGQTPLGFPYSAVPPDFLEHCRVLEEYKSVPFSQWNVKAIVAWMESGLGMSQFTAVVREKVTSGHAMLALTESDMERKLGIVNPLHRRKFRLAIDDQRGPPHACPFPHAGKIDHSWVAFEWATDCGFQHLTEVLAEHLVDGRVLNSLSRDDLKKYLKISKKLDQLSFLSGVELLRMHEFNREAIQDHRRTSRNPLYWTNRDVYDWLKDIQLQEYANNVIGTGVHGALLFLERGTFTAENLAAVLHFPSSKSQLKRHLTNKLSHLFSGELDEHANNSSLQRASPDKKHHSHRHHSSPQRHHHHHHHHHHHSRPLSQPTTDHPPHPSHRKSLSQGPSITSPTITSPPSFHFQPITSVKNSTLSPSPIPPSNRLSTSSMPSDRASPAPMPPSRPSSVTPGFYRTSSQPTVLSRRVRSPPPREDHVRHSLRESALRSLATIRSDSSEARSMTPVNGTTV